MCIRDRCGFALIALGCGLVIIAAVDVPLTLWQHNRQLRMSREEIREESKETEGNPEIRGRVRRVQQAMARRRMMQEVKKADVIVTNPTHYAVALRYDEKHMRAPVVVAKGADLIALRIREIGLEHGVPTVDVYKRQVRARPWLSWPVPLDPPRRRNAPPSRNC